MKINKTISIDFDLVEQVLDEAEEMHRDFSSTISILVRMGLDGRRLAKEESK